MGEIAASDPATVWLMHGCGLRIGEALAVTLRCRINRGKILRVKEQVNPVAQLKPLKFRPAGEFRDIRCRSTSATRSTGTSPGTTPRPTGTCSRVASTSSSSALAEGIPITEVSRCLGHKSIEVTHQIYGKSRELHRPGEKPQVSRSQDGRNGVPAILMPAV